MILFKIKVFGDLVVVAMVIIFKKKMQTNHIRGKCNNFDYHGLTHGFAILTSDCFQRSLE